jgi:pimeloyl-ACP methyl ester carboxylesterase
VRPFPYAEEEVTFRNESASLRLTGTLTRPRSKGRVPAVLLITGSGQQDRDETIAGHKPFLVLADHLTRLGVAVLRVDDRGIGGSERGPATATSNDFAGDVAAGVAFLRGRSDVDPVRVGLIGHSEGAVLAAMAAAASPDVAFIVMLAGPGLPGNEVLYSQVAMLARAAGASDAAIAWDRSVRERVFAVVKAETDGRPNAALRQKLLDDLAAQPRAAAGLPDGAAARQLGQVLLGALSSPWLRFFLAYDPRPALARVRVPVLAIGGGKDVQVAAAENLKEIERAVRGGGNQEVATVLMPNLNHLLQTSTTGLPGEYATIEETVAPEMLTLVSDWVGKIIAR